jgi:hypothetical protein
MFVYKSLGDPRALWHNMAGGVGTSRIARRPPKRDTERSGVACVVLLIYGCIKMRFVDTKLLYRQNAFL